MMRKKHFRRSHILCLCVSECHTFKRDEKATSEMERPVHVTEVHQQSRFYSLSTGRAAHYKVLKPHVPSPEEWCVLQNMEGLEYLLVEPACEVNEKGTRGKNDGNESMSMDDNEKIEVGSDEASSAEEDWNEPKQDEMPKWTEPDLPMTTETRKGGCKKTGIGITGTVRTS